MNPEKTNTLNAAGGEPAPVVTDSLAASALATGSAFELSEVDFMAVIDALSEIPSRRLLNGDGYMLCLAIERRLNGIENRGICWRNLHKVVLAWRRAVASWDDGGLMT